MAGSIKGLNIEIGGTTTKLSQALKEPAKQTQELKSKLKDVNTALKFDTNNVDLLNQKQRILTETINSTEDELKLLKEAQKQYIESGKPIDGAEYVALESKIAIVEKSLQNLKKEQNNFTGELQALGAKVGEFGGKAEALGKKFLPVTAAITGIGTASYAAWQELDQAYDGIAAGTGATGEALEELKDNFDNVFGSMPDTAEDCSTAIADVSTRFGLTGRALEDASVKFLKFAEVNNADVSTSIEYVAKAMADAGIDSSELGAVLDELTVVSQSSGLSVDTLASSLSANGVTMRQLGYDTEDTIAMLATFEKNGVDTSTVLTGMKTAVKSCAAAGTDAKEEMAALFQKIRDGSASAADAQELFGKKAGAAIYEYAKEGKLNFEELLEVCQNSAGGMEASYDAMLDPVDQFNVALNNLKIVGTDLFETIQGAFAPILEKVVDKIKEVTDWFKNLSEEQKENIVKWAGIAAAIGPVLIAVGKVGQGFSNAIKYFGSTTTMGGKVVATFKSMTGAASISTGALAGIVAVIALVVAAFVNLWQNNEEFRDKMTAIWNGLVEKFQDFSQGIVDRLNALGFSFEDITEVIKAVWDGFCEVLAPVFEAAWQIISDVLGTVLDVLTGLLDVFIGLFTGDWGTFLQGIKEIFSGIWEGIKGIFQASCDALKGILDVFLSWFGTDWETVWNNIKTFFENIWNSSKSFFETTWNSIKSTCANVWNSIKSTCQAVWNSIKTFFEDIWNVIKSLFETAGNNIKSTCTNAWNSIKSTCQTVWNSIKTFFEGIWNAIKSLFETTWNNIKSTCTNVWNSIKSTCQTVWNSIKSHIVDPIQSAYESVKIIFSNIYTWISDKINAARDTVGNAIEKIKGFFNFEFKWPHIPLPHFSISGSLNPLDWLDGGLPSIGVEWYRKAMDTGTILNGASVFGSVNGNLLAGGEAGPEAVIGVSSLQDIIRGAVNDGLKSVMEAYKEQPEPERTETFEFDYDRLASTLISALAGLVVAGDVSIDGKRAGTFLAPFVDKQLQVLAAKR